MQITIILIIMYLCFNYGVVFGENVAVIEFNDYSVQKSIGAQDRIRLIMEKIFPPERFSFIDKETTQKLFPISTQRALGTITPTLSKMIGKLLNADIVLIGNYKVEKGEILMHFSLFDTHRTLIDFTEIQEFFESPFLIEGKVVGVANEVITLNIGTRKGVEIGTNFSIIQLDKEVGKVQVIKVKEASSEALLIEGNKPSVGDKVNKSTVSFNTYPSNQIWIVTSIPSGAYVYIDETLKGISPLIIKGSMNEIKQLRLEKDGYEYYPLNIQVSKIPYSSLDIFIVEFMPSSSPIVKKLGPKRKEGVTYAKLEPGYRLFTVETPFLLECSELLVGLGYPEGLLLKVGLPVGNIEARIAGLGIGLKRRLNKQFALDIYYETYDLRHNKEEISKGGSLLYSFPTKLPIRPFNIYMGTGYVEQNSNGEFRYFGGLDTPISHSVKFLTEWDKINGWAAGFQYHPYEKISVDIGLGMDPDEWRYDLQLVYSGNDK